MSDLLITRGDDEKFELTFTDEDSAVVDLTGCKVYLTIKEHESDAFGDALIAVSQTSHTNAVGGITEIEIPNATTATLTAGSYVYDIQVKDASDKIKTSIIGNVTVVLDITDSTA